MPTRTRPATFPSPFDELGPSGLARSAAQAMQDELGAGLVAPGVPATLLEVLGGGKMFGVLVVEQPDGSLGVLRAFSGILAGRWDIDGYVPPMFDRESRERIEPAGEATVKALIARAEALRSSPEFMALCAEDEAQQARHAEQRSTMRLRHDERRRRRHQRREQLSASDALSGSEKREALHVLDQESRGDKAERRRLDEFHRAERLALAPRRARFERRLQALERLRRMFCRALMKQLFDTYRVPNARGEQRLLRTLYGGMEPPSGAGDCAAPKLLAFALSRGLRPLALAEFWWGAPPMSGARIQGAFYPACRDKCGPLLPYMLEGIEVAPTRTFSPPKPETGDLSIVFEDEALVVIDKPVGLLSVPGRDPSCPDSVLTRLRARHPHATGPLLVHRLDLDTSGLLVAALDARTHADLQRQFLLREVHKRYVAWLQGAVASDGGTIELAFRVDVNDRPRQIYDPVHGKKGTTDWQVLERRGDRTRVAFHPRTGRTHQLRVHAAHPLGLGAPIVGDRLYGREDVRLFLHAELLTFRHPASGQHVSFERAASF